MLPNGPIPVEAFYLTPGASGSLQQQIRAMVAAGDSAGDSDRGTGCRRHAGWPASGRQPDHGDAGLFRLVSPDYLTSAGRSGYFVSENAPCAGFSGQRPRPRRWISGLSGRRYSQLPWPARPADWGSYPYPFIYGQADPTLFDHQNWRLCALRALGRRDFEALTSD